MKKCDKCQLSIPYSVIEGIFNICSEETFKNFGVKTALLKTLPNENEELEELSMKKIGLIATSKYVQSLTFNDLENMKFVASKNSELEKFLCNSKIKSLSLDSPDPTHRWFKLEEYEGMKDLLEENEYFRWTFCSGVFAIHSSSNLVCFPSKYRNCGDVLRNLPANDSVESLRQCRKIARAEEFQHSAICN
uniref:Uncharacterized protein n=1 Tax=Panagrolaimus davidi TaxID=227884 RepID=A0A914PYK7_9BILA